MATLAADRQTPVKGQNNLHLTSHPVAASAKIYCGAMVMLDATGYAVQASATGVGIVKGIADEQKDNTSGLDGALEVKVRSGEAYKMANSETSAVTQAYDGKPCFVEDEETVCIDPSKPYAGIVDSLESDGVYVIPTRTSPGEADVAGSNWASTQTLAAGTALVFSPNQKYYPVVGSGGAVTLTADFPDGSYAGQEIILVGTHDTNKVTVPTGKNTKTADGLSVELADDCFLPMVWDGSDWVQNGPMVHAA